jgi:ABC-type lipoprotein export system ATPase subunit
VNQDHPGDIIVASNVVKTYRTGTVVVEALRGVSITVERGAIVSIMGPSGCGKTTLLNCLSGLDEFDSGQITVDGTDITRMSDNDKTEYRARNMGFIFQFYNLLPVLSAAENVELPLIVAGMTPKAARAAALDALDLVGLRDWASHKPAQLSGGQRQRVTIARSLVNRPAIVWADEPTGDLDSTTATEVMDLILRLNRENSQTFVIVTHGREIAERTERIIHMRDGLIESVEQLRAPAGIPALAR